MILAYAQGSAQQHRWTIGLDVGRTHYGGTSRDTASGDDQAFRPANSTVWSLHASRRVGGFGVGLIGSYGTAGFALDGPELLLVDRTTGFTFYELAPVIGIHLTGLGNDGMLALTGGPVVSLWRLTDQPDRSRLGARLGLSLPVWFGQTLGGMVRLDGVVTPSVFEYGELPEDFILPATWRVQVSMGVLAGF
jgi:hypothetical protein